MKNSIAIGSVKGIRIEIHISWVAIFLLVTYLMATSYFPVIHPEWGPPLTWILGAVVALLLFLSVLLHELSHSLVSLREGIGVKRISLFIFGGVAQIEKEPDQPLQELKIAIAGPAMSLFLFLFLRTLEILLTNAGASPVIIEPVSYMSTANLILAAFNLVPAFPMDGGRVLRALIWHFKKNLQLATRVTTLMGSFFGYFLSFVGLYWVFNGFLLNGLWYLFIGWYLSQASSSSYQNMVMTDLFNKIPVREFMVSSVVTVPYYMPLEDLVDEYFYKYKFTCFPILKEAQVIGIVTLENLKSTNRTFWNQTTVAQIATPIAPKLTVAPSDTVATAMERIFSNGIGRVLVMDESRLVGIVSKTDLLNYIRIRAQLKE